jgi:hypothetical protein
VLERRLRHRWRSGNQENDDGTDATREPDRCMKLSLPQDDTLTHATP